jgi:hypothetical protein
MPLRRWRFVAADYHMGLVRRSVFTKDGIERAIHTTRVCLQAIYDCIPLSLDFESGFNPISRPSFLVEIYKNHDIHLVIPLVEMIHSRDSTAYYFEFNDALLMSGTVQSCTCVRQGEPVGPLVLNLEISIPLRNFRYLCRESSAIMAFLAMESFSLQRLPTRL